MSSQLTFPNQRETWWVWKFSCCVRKRKKGVRLPVLRNFKYCVYSHVVPPIWLHKRLHTLLPLTRPESKQFKPSTNDPCLSFSRTVRGNVCVAATTRNSLHTCSCFNFGVKMSLFVPLHVDLYVQQRLIHFLSHQVNSEDKKWNLPKDLVAYYWSTSLSSV